MQSIKIMLDFLGGPIRTSHYDEKSDRFITGIDTIDKDKYLQNLNDEISGLYSSYYHFDYKGKACFFDKEQEKKDKYKMLDLLAKLIKRLDELNDGSFEIDDRETDRIKNL